MNKLNVLTDKQIESVNLIKENLKSKGILAELNACADDEFTWIEINLVDPSVVHLEYISKIKADYELSLDERSERSQSNKNLAKVHFVAINVKYTVNIRNKAWAWVQKKFQNDVGRLPKDFNDLNTYHVGSKSGCSAFKYIEYALLGRFKNVNFWAEN